MKRISLSITQLLALLLGVFIGAWLFGCTPHVASIDMMPQRVDETRQRIDFSKVCHCESRMMIPSKSPFFQDICDVCWQHNAPYSLCIGCGRRICERCDRLPKCSKCKPVVQRVQDAENAELRQRIAEMETRP